MFDRILDIIVKIWADILPFEVVKVYEAGAVLRFGKFHRKVGPGLAWKIPFAEDIITANTVLTTLRLIPQTLTTADNHSVVIGAIIKYKIADVEAYVTQIWDQNDVLADVTMGAIGDVVSKSNWADMLRDRLDVIDVVRRQVNQYGFRIHNITFTDFGRVRSLRLIQQPVTTLEN